MEAGGQSTPMAQAVPIAEAIAVPMPTPMQPAADPPGIVDEKISPSELWRSCKKFHPDQGRALIRWTIAFGIAMTVFAVLEVVEFFADGGLDFFSADYNATAAAAAAGPPIATEPTFLAARILDLFIVGDIYRRFKMAYRLEDGSERPRPQRACQPYEARGRLETRSNKVASKYLRSWFAVDVLCLVNSLLDILEVVAANDPLTASMPLRWMRVLRALQLAKVMDSRSIYVAKSIFVARA